MGSRPGDRYQLLHPVWRDGFGTTHIGRGPDGAPAAVRVLAPELAADPAVVHRAVTDRALLTGIRHPNLAGVRDVLVGDGVAIAARPVLGTALRRWRGPLTGADLRRIGAGIVAGLRALHDHGVWHRNLSPATVVLTGTGEVVLTDIAVGHLVGTPGAAETDLSALGEVLTGLWRAAHPRWTRRPPALRLLLATHPSERLDVWADTMAGARDMG
jgi:serine/threonine protein kinase